MNFLEKILKLYCALKSLSKKMFGDFNRAFIYFKNYWNRPGIFRPENSQGHAKNSCECPKLSGTLD